MGSGMSSGGKVLLVDDDLFHLNILKQVLVKSGFSVYEFSDPQSAIHFFDDQEDSFFDCVVSDYQMPKLNGLELFHHLREKDGCVGGIIITSEEDQHVVQESLRAGITDFLGKPIHPSELLEAVSRAVSMTWKNRQLRETTQGLLQAKNVNFLFDEDFPAFEGYLNVFYHPRDQIGGDFMSIFQSSEEKHVIVLGDISGHNLRSALIASYCKGLLQGLMSKHVPIEHIFEIFNHTLSKQMNCGEPFSSENIFSSLSACSLEIDDNLGRVELLNYGFPFVMFFTKDGRMFRSSRCSSPLGWDYTYNGIKEEIDSHDCLFMYVFTDGLPDFAVQHNLNPFSLAYKMLQKKKEVDEEFLQSSNDDILIARYQFVRKIRASTLIQPLFAAYYPGSDFHSIDELQANWEKSLLFALGEKVKDRLDEIILCCREAMLNGLIHGCNREENLHCNLQINYKEMQNELTIRIDDPGPGHDFDSTLREKLLLEDPASCDCRRLGLVMISRLADKMDFLNRGATIIMTFSL
ncbi:MAG: hypothetical protein A2007_04545 [Verrucomicrobia bacterium GWC2_42_7]|nr:MAG: hypothetical protein A2007_04545 [Verrucomicrobia bacterium GWC2_42_7]